MAELEDESSFPPQTGVPTAPPPPLQPQAEPQVVSNSGNQYVNQNQEPQFTVPIHQPQFTVPIHQPQGPQLQYYPQQVNAYGPQFVPGGSFHNPVYQNAVNHPMQFAPHHINPNGPPGAVVYTAPHLVVPNPRINQQLQPWKSDLFGCMDDPSNAIITACIPCVTFGQIAEIVERGNTTCETSGLLYGLVFMCIGLPCIMSCTYRTKLRNMFILAEVPAPDWMTHFLCELCSLCQEYRELQLRGFDPAIGWQGNVARNTVLVQHPAVMMVPPMNQTMG